MQRVAVRAAVGEVNLTILEISTPLPHPKGSHLCCSASPTTRVPVVRCLVCGLRGETGAEAEAKTKF